MAEKDIPQSPEIKNKIDLNKIKDPKIFEIMERKHEQIIAALGKNIETFGPAIQSILEKAGAIAIGAIISSAHGEEMNPKMVAINELTSVSTNVSTNKGLEYGQYTKDGRKFETLSEEDVGKLDIREKIAYKKWSIENEKQKTINIRQAADKEDEKAITNKTEADKEGEKAIKEEARLVENREKAITNKTEADKEGEKVIAEYRKMIINFTQLHKNKSTAPIYFTIKEDLKKVLLSGKPPEIIPELEKIRGLLMS